MGRIKPLIHRDQIHKDTNLDPLSVALLDSAPLQRLGRVYQLGYAHLVFRGGTHTRLSHVMGASHTAGQLVASLRANYAPHNAEFRPPGAVPPEVFLPLARAPQRSEKRKEGKLENRWSFLSHVCRWAALLHDVGHIPMGHTLEDEYEQIYKKHDDFMNPRLPSLWMDLQGESEIKKILLDTTLYPPSFDKLELTGQDVYDTVLLVCCHKEDRTRGRTFEQVLQAEQDGAKIKLDNAGGESADAEDLRFCELLVEALKRQESRGAFSVFMADLVANTICADYLDYMQRDPYNVGLDVLSDPRVASRFYVGLDPRWGYRMALSLVDRSGKPRMDTASGVFELVRQRFRFAETIYYHKTKVAASAMFVKALGLLRDRPEASGPINKQIELGEVDAYTDSVLKSPKELKDLRKRHEPANLLSPDIGDDSLHLYLQNKAWDQIAAAVEEPKTSPDQEAICRETVRDAFAAISLLSGIVRRRLYKQCFYLDAAGASAVLGFPSTEESTRLDPLIAQLRGNHGNHGYRSKLEEDMCRVAEMPQGAFIIYVPERKSQAKGVETFAISKTGVITLGRHQSLVKKMDELNNDYRNLWRLLVFVEPTVSDEHIRISKALDHLVLCLARSTQNNPELSADHLSLHRVEEWMMDGSRVSYVRREHRQAAARFAALCDADDKAVKSATILREVSHIAAERSSTLESDTHAQVAFLAVCLARDGVLDTWARTKLSDMLAGDALRSALRADSTLVFAANGEIDSAQDAQLAACIRKLAEQFKREHEGESDQPELFR